MTDVETETEDSRLDALARLGLLDTHALQGFDRIARLAAQALDCPMAYISLLDRERQVIKAQYGVTLGDGPRVTSFCTHTIASESAFVVDDTHADARFCENPLVVGEPGIRFYAGARIHGLDQPLGSLCVIDRLPRRFDDRQRAMLADLAAAVDALIDRHDRNVRLAEANAELVKAATLLSERNALFEQVEKIAGIGWWLFDLDSGALSWSDQVYRIHEMEVGAELDVESAIEQYVLEDRMMVRRFLERTVTTGRPYTFEGRLDTPSDEVRHVRSAGRVIETNDGGRRLVGIIQDITREHRANEDLRRSATRDSLTGMYNRTVFDETLR